ncbi:MAG: hypothetical protein U1E76_00250 [Planctomycetota bacterium]
MTESPLPAATHPRHQRTATTFWLLTVVNLIAAAVLWLRPLPVGTEPGPGSSAALAPSGRKTAAGPVDTMTFVAAPPVPGRPSRAALDAAIERGLAAYLRLYVEPSLANAEAGGYLDYVDAKGNKQRLGPKVYVQCQLYLIVHLLLYQEELGLPRDHPLVQRALAFLVSSFDSEAGRWLWSEEGCLHAKGLIVLARFGEQERFEKGWRWAKSSPLYLEEQGLFTMMQSGKIVQTLGPGSRSLCGVDAWDHGSPIIDEENSTKFLYALLTGRKSIADPEVASLAERLSAYFVRTPMTVEAMQTKEIVGRSWAVAENARARFPIAQGFQLALEQLRRASRGEWRRNFMLRVLPCFRGEMLNGMLEAGERNDEIDAIVNGLVAAQDSDGAWHLPHLKQLWGLDMPSAQGYRFGNLDGANTYMVTLTLIRWRKHVQNG